VAAAGQPSTVSIVVTYCGKWWFVMCVFGCYRRQEMQQMRGMRRPHDGAAVGWPAETKRPAMPSAGYIPSAARYA